MAEIQLRKIRLSDAKALSEILSDEEVLKTLDPKHPFPVPEERIKDRIPKDKENFRLGKAYKFVMVRDGKTVGQISLYNPDKSRKSYEIGYFVRRDFWNKGIATEAVKRIVKYGFESLLLDNIRSVVPKNNPASIRVLEKVGFKKVYENEKEIRLLIQQ